MNTQEAKSALIERLEVLETEKIKLIHEIWRIESKCEIIREKLTRLGYVPITELNTEEMET